MCKSALPFCHQTQVTVTLHTITPPFPCLPLPNTRHVTDGKASIGFLQPSEPAGTGRTALLTAKGWTPLCKPQRAGLVVHFPEPLTFGTWALRSPQNQSRSAERSGFEPKMCPRSALLAQAQKPLPLLPPPQQKWIHVFSSQVTQSGVPSIPEVSSRC